MNEDTVEATATPATPATTTGVARREVQFEVKVDNDSPFDELVINPDTFGLNAPTAIEERSGNSYLLDPARPMLIDSEGLHMYFKPPLPGAGTYGFKVLCSYDGAVTGRTAEPA